MILVADSGSTKTTWAVVETGHKIVTEGLNPHLCTDDQIVSACNTIRHQLPSTLNAIHFYGAGCGSNLQQERMRNLLHKAFGSVNVTINSDMMGACRSLCGNEPSLVGILGTGSNACYYNGFEISIKTVSTGYILGDHGSANHVGRLMLQDFLTGRMPKETSCLFQESCNLDYDTVMENVYHRPNANRWLAATATFAAKHLDNSYCTAIVHRALDSWYNEQLCGLVEQSGYHTISIVGGFAAAIEPLLREYLPASKSLTIANVTADPINGLLQFHSF